MCFPDHWGLHDLHVLHHHASSLQGIPSFCSQNADWYTSTVIVLLQNLYVCLRAGY